MQAQPPTVTDLERGGGFYALLFVLFWVGVAIFWGARQAVKILKEQAVKNEQLNERQIVIMDKQIHEGREQVAKLITAFERSLDIHEAQSKSAASKRRRV